VVTAVTVREDGTAVSSRLESVYERSPVWAQDLMVSGQGALFRTLRTSDRILARDLGNLLLSEQMDGDRRRTTLGHNLRRIVQHAAETTPYYRRLAEDGKFPAIWNSRNVFEEMGALPMLDKATVRSYAPLFYSTRLGREPRVHLFTSGTTGSPLKTLETRSSMSRRFAFVARLRTWAGIASPLHPRRIQFTGRSICQDDAPFWRRNKADNSILFSTVHISEANAAAYSAAISESDAQLMDGYPSAMLSLARLCKAAGLPLPQVPVIISTAETLTSDMLSELEDSYGARVFNQYASTEPSCFWSTCELGSLHVHEEYGLSEILDEDGQPVEPGKTGEIVVTSVLNPAMPLIRYRTGDIARRGVAESCACGRDLPIAEEVIGRQDDILYVPERGYVGRLDPVFKGLTGIVEAQIVQETLDLLVVNVVEGGDGLGDKGEQALMSNLRSKIGTGIAIEIRKVQAIPRGPNGKFRSVISRPALASGGGGG
jgi:phenylacetate-CoA ligase